MSADTLGVRGRNATARPMTAIPFRPYVYRGSGYDELERVALIGGVPEDAILNSSDAARILGLSIQIVRPLLASIEYRTVGGHRRYRREDVERLRAER